MKHAKIVQFLVSGLLVVSFAGGCGGSAPVNAERLIENYADDAARYADDALLARQAARAASDTGELRTIFNKAETAAQQAQRAAEEAEAAGQQVKDLQSQTRLMEELQSARRSAEIARRSRTSLSEVLENPELIPAWMAVDDVSSDIVQRRIEVEPGPEQEQIRQAFRNVVAASFCNALVETVDQGKLPDQQQVIDDLAKNMRQALIMLSGAGDIAQEILSKVSEFVLHEPEDDLAKEKEYCQKVFEQ